MCANRMCRGSHGCGSPTLRSLRRRLPMRFTSSTTAPFYNLRPLNARRSPRVKPRARKGREPKSPPCGASPRLPTLLLVLAQEEQVQERQERGQGRCYVGEGRRRKYALGTVRLAAGEYTVAGQKAVGAGGG